MADAKRRRMYLFERAYVDYVTGLRRFSGKLWQTCGAIWTWFWSGPGATAFEIALRLAIVIVTIALCVLYVRYELDHGREFSLGTLLAILGIGLFASLVLWGWKAPLHFAARVVSGASASGLILVLAVLVIAFAIVVFSVYLLVLFTLTILSFIVFLPIRGIHSLWLLHRRIAYRCPYDDCGYSGLPIHVCSCGHRYKDLQPSFYGIFYHVCRHDGEKVKLPTLDVLGRNKLTRLCGRCERPLILSSIGELAERPIAVVGGPNVGKTVFLRQATRHLRDHLDRMPGSTVRIDSEDQMRELEVALRLLDRGETPAKTTGTVMQAFGLAVRVPKQLRCLLYLFDAPGEHFLTMAELGRKQTLQHIAGIILLVDPFSLPALSDHVQRLDETLKPSEEPLQRIVDVLVNGVNMMLVRRPTDRCDVPLAVVLSKADAFPIGDFPFLIDLCGGDGHAADNTRNARCRQALEKLGAGRSVHCLEQKFSRVRYFVCTAQGRRRDPSNTSPFHPVGVIDPFLWLLEMN